MLKLEFPNESHREMYEDMIHEWSQEEDFHDTSPGAMFFGESYDEFLKIMELLRKGSYKGYTPSSLLFLIDGDKLIGGIDIRHNIVAPVLHDYGGHIGYGIRPSQRRKGYATRLLALGLMEARKLDIKKVLISCHPENAASEKVILGNGGEYFETKMRGNEIYKKYWITL